MRFGNVCSTLNVNTLFSSRVILYLNCYGIQTLVLLAKMYSSGVTVVQTRRV